MSWASHLRNIAKEVWKLRSLMVHKNKAETFYRPIYWDIILLTLYFLFLFSAMCVALIFINDFHGPFKIYSPLKKNGYLVSGSEFQLKFIVNRPELHGVVEFSAQDPAGKSNLLLNGKSSILEPVVRDCPIFRKISVTSLQGDVKCWKLNNFLKIIS